MATPTRLDYCQYLLSSPINYTITHFADHSEGFSHDMINRYLSGDRITPHLVWENVSPYIIPSEQGYVIFDDTVLDKRYSFNIALVRRQYSGNAHQVIKGVGVVTCVYVNPEIDQFWILDYRIYDPDGDGKTKLVHVQEMLSLLVYQGKRAYRKLKASVACCTIGVYKQLPFESVLMDSWYATKDLMLHLEKLEKRYYCPLKVNRLVDDFSGLKPYQRIDALMWTATELKKGKRIKIKGFPKNHKVKLFRLVSSTRRTYYVATNDLACNSTSVAQDACDWRWKIEPFHREGKQLTGIQRCQCRLARMVRNHIGCAILVWIRLKQVAQETVQTIYQVKNGLLSEYLRQQLKSPSIKMMLA